MANKDESGRDERAMKAMREVLMQRVLSGIILDAQLRLPDWRRRRRVSWPIDVWVLYRDSEAKDIGWLYDKFLADLRDAGVRPDDVKLMFQPLAPDEATEPSMAARASRMGTLSLKEIDADERRREARENVRRYGG